MVAVSNGVRQRLPEHIDPSLKKQRKGRWKPIEYLCAPCGEPEKTDSDCWVCVSHRHDATGYIHYSVTDSAGNTKGTSLHRVVYELAMGKALWPELFACHRCDVPFCINPAHIFPGTIQDNHADMIAKGRNEATVGANHWNAKLDEAAVWDMRLRYIKGEATQKALANEYGVTGLTANKAIHCKSWKRR